MRRLSLGVVAIATALLASCASSGVAESVHPGLPQGFVYANGNEEPAVGWVDDGVRFAVVTWGSSSCPAVAKEFTFKGDDRVEIAFGQSPQELCTADMAPTTHEFDLPRDITNRPIAVTLRFDDWDEKYTHSLE